MTIVIDIQVSVLRGVVTALLAAAREGEEEVRSSKIPYWVLDSAIP